LIAVLIAGMHIFVAHFLLLRILADSTPPASASVPLVGKLTAGLFLLLARFGPYVANRWYQALSRRYEYWRPTSHYETFQMAISLQRVAPDPLYVRRPTSTMLCRRTQSVM